MTVRFTEAVQEHLVPIEDCTEYPDNPRRGDTKALRESIEANGFYSVLIGQISTGYIVAGNHRLRVLREMGADAAPVLWMDMSDDDARRIVLADNRTSDLAYYDDPTLFKLLQDLDGDLRGTGYDKASYELLLQGLEGDEVLGNVSQGYVPEERQAGFVGADIRSIILPYGGDEYDTVADGMVALRSAFNMETNADLVAYLVKAALQDPEALPAV